MHSSLSHLSGPLRSLLTALVLLPAIVSAATEIHIAPAPAGDDGNSGTRAQPVATPQGAQLLVRNRITSGLSDAVEVIFAAGTYHMNAPLELRPEDSGTAAFPITWRAATGATVMLSGGKPVTGTWTEAGKGIWHVDLPETTGDWNFRQLFVDGQRATRARFPNADEANPFLYATGGGMDHAVIDPKLIKASWGTAADAQINIVPHWKFFNQWNTVTGVDAAKGRIDFSDSERHGKITRGNWFWIEGVREELDQSGEWHLDRKQSRLYYMPEAGKDPNNLTIIAPRLNVIVDAKGEVERRTHVEHVRFKDLQFRHTTFTLGHIEARVHTDAAMRLENANGFRIENCHFENIGGYALWLHLDSQRNVIHRNTVLNSGGGGVLLTGARLSYMDDSKLHTPGKVAATVFPILNHVTRNTVKHCGKLRYYGGGVHLDSRPASMAMAPGNYIAHNYFADLSRNGIFAFRNQGGNIIEYNHIHDVMQTTVDGACIHFATMSHLNAPNHILNNWLHDIWGYERKPNGKPERHLANGVFLDWATSNTTVKGNCIYNAGGKPVKNIMGNWNLNIADNQTSKTRTVPSFANEVGPKGTATHGIDLDTNRLTGGVVHYSDSQQVSRSGDWKQRAIDGFWGLFSFNLLEAAPSKPATISYTLPITEDGTYQVSLLYLPNKKNAGNAGIRIIHADGASDLTWNMKKGDKFGFAIELGKYSFRKGGPARVVISNDGADGLVVANSVAFMRIRDEGPSQRGSRSEP